MTPGDGSMGGLTVNDYSTHLLLAAMWGCIYGLCLLVMYEQVNQMPVVAGTDLVLTIKASPSVDVTGGLIKTETKVRLPLY